MMAVEVAYSPRAGVVDLVRLEVPAGTTLAEALAASGIEARHGLLAGAMKVGIWGRLQPDLGVVVREHDRIEVYRGLQVDPKEARRLRYQRHKALLATLKPRIRP